MCVYTHMLSMCVRVYFILGTWAHVPRVPGMEETQRIPVGIFCSFWLTGVEDSLTAKTGGPEKETAVVLSFLGAAVEMPSDFRAWVSVAVKWGRLLRVFPHSQRIKEAYREVETHEGHKVVHDMKEFHCGLILDSRRKALVAFPRTSSRRKL